MPELRRNLITGDWVVIATERAKRPEDFKKKDKQTVSLPRKSPLCPFCPGNEDKTPPETFSVKSGKTWKVRVVPNRFSALTPDGEPVRSVDGMRHSMVGVGVHEVIVETPRHDLTLALLSPDEIKNVLSAYTARMLAHSKDQRIQMVILFKNHGESAGTSLEHPHSQLVGTPVVPFHIRHRIQESIRFYDDTGKCVFCAVAQDEAKAGSRVVLGTQHFLSFIPYAAFSPFHLWIFPKRHCSSFHSVSSPELHDLASLLKEILSRLYFGLDNPDYNFIIRSSPFGVGEVSYFHWYLSIVPRLTKAAGFELGSGMYINTALPEKSAEFLRNLKVPQSEKNT